MGCRVAGCMRWHRDGRTDSRRRTCVAPESTRIGDGMMEHKRAGMGRLSSDSSSSESSDSNASNGLGWKKWEVRVGGTTVWTRGNVE
jgi:hypothetical protein